jgi:hypothetical protein
MKAGNIKQYSLALKTIFNNWVRVFPPFSKIDWKVFILAQIIAGYITILTFFLIEISGH